MDGLFPDSDDTVEVCQPSTADYRQSELEATGTLEWAEGLGFRTSKLE
jgi:hypothetical protein